MLYIAKEESLEISEDAIRAIYDISGGDMRKAINAIQSASSIGKRISPDMIYDITATARPDEISDLIDTAFHDFTKALEKLDFLMDDRGIPPDEILKQIHSVLLRMDIPADEKLHLVEKIGEIDYRIAEGANERIQLEALIAFLFLEKKSKEGHQL